MIDFGGTGTEQKSVSCEFHFYHQPKTAMGQYDTCLWDASHLIVEEIPYYLWEILAML
jgi:hypothetical protein